MNYNKVICWFQYIPNSAKQSSNTTLYRILLNKVFYMGGFAMKGTSIEERAVALARYIIDSKDTVRGTAKKFGVSKSTVHKDLSQRLEKINQGLFIDVRKVLDENKAERHIRGGMATKKKYEKMKMQPRFSYERYCK